MPPRAPHSSNTRTALRFCGSCCVTVGCWALWIVLGASLALLATVAITKELPVPGFVLRQVEARLERAANLTITFGRAQVDPAGQLLLQDVQVRVPPYPEAVLTSRLALVRLDFWSLLGLPQAPTEIRLEGAALQLPAMLSPSGATEPLVRDLALVLHHEEKYWHLDQLTARVGRLALTAQGDYAPPVRASGQPPPDLSAWVTRFLRQGPAVAVALHRLESFDSPSLAIELSGAPGVGNTAQATFTALAVHQPWGQPWSLGPMALATSLRLDADTPHLLRVHSAAESGSWPGQAAAGPLRAVVTAQLPSAGQPLRLHEALLAAGRVEADGEVVTAPVLRADLSGWPATVRVEAAVQLSGEFLVAEVEAALREQSARISAHGRGDPGFINRVLAHHTPRAAPFFVFGDPVIFEAQLAFSPGWKFAQLRSRVNAGRLDSRGVAISSLAGRVDIDGMDFLAHDARVTLADNEARGSYAMNFSSTDYRMLLHGRLRPPAIQGWFNGPWWTDFWNEHFSFPVAPPAADVDVQGRWRDPTRTLFYGRAEARGARVWGADFEHAQARVFLRPHFTHVLDCVGTQAGDTRRLTGSLKRFADPVTRETNRLEFDAAGNLEPVTYRRMLAGKGDAVIDLLQFSEAPQVQARGFLAGRWPALAPHFTFTGQTAGPLHFCSFPLDYASVRGRLDPEILRLEEVRFGLGGGAGEGRLSLGLDPTDPRRLGFDLNLTNAELVRVIRTLEEYQTNRSGVKSPSATESKFIRQAAAGRMQVALSAEGDPAALIRLSGNGHAAFTGADLGEIHLFGLLSQALSGLSLNFSSLKLDAAHTTFRMADGHVWFPDLKITGPSAVIEAKGDLALATNQLDFTAKLKPYEENRNLLTAALGLVITPLTSIFELKLSGPLSKPDWTIVVGPSSHQPTPPSAPAPAATTPAPKPPAATPAP